MSHSPRDERRRWPEGLSGELMAAYRSILEASSEQEAVSRGTDVAREIFGADLTWCALASGDSLIGVAFSGWRRSRQTEPYIVPMGEGIGGRVLAEGRTTIVRNYHRDPRRLSWLKARLDDEDVRAGYVAPFQIGDRPGGALYVGWRTSRPLSEEEAADVTVFARDLGAFLRAAREREAGAGHAARERLLEEFSATLVSRGSLNDALRLAARELDLRISLNDGYGHETLAVGGEDRAETEGPDAALDLTLAGQLGVLRITRNDAALSPDDEQTARQLARLVALQLQRERSIAETQDRLGSEFVEELVAGTDNAGKLLRQAGLLGIDLRRPRAVAYVGIQVGPGGTVHRSPRQTGRRWVDELLRTVRARHRGVLSAEREGGVVLVLEPLGSDHDLKETLSASIEGVTTTVGSRLCAGLGRVANVVADFPESLAEAEAAFTVAASRAQPGVVLNVADLGLHGLLLQAVRPGALHDLVESTLGPLTGAAGQGRTQLLATLASYFDHEGNNERTAADLHVHVNTLRYRLQRIQETLDIDLHNPESRFLIELAVRTWQVLENPPPADDGDG